MAIVPKVFIILFFPVWICNKKFIVYLYTINLRTIHDYFYYFYYINAFKKFWEVYTKINVCTYPKYNVQYT